MKKKYFGITELLKKYHYIDFSNFINNNSTFCDLEISIDEYAKLINSLKGKNRLSEYKRALVFKSDLLLLDLKHLKEFGSTNIVVQQNIANNEEQIDVNEKIKTCTNQRTTIKKQLAVINFFEIKKQQFLYDKTEANLTR